VLNTTSKDQVTDAAACYDCHCHWQCHFAQLCAGSMCTPWQRAVGSSQQRELISGPALLRATNAVRLAMPLACSRSGGQYEGARRCLFECCPDALPLPVSTKRTSRDMYSAAVLAKHHCDICKRSNDQERRASPWRLVRTSMELQRSWRKACHVHPFPAHASQLPKHDASCVLKSALRFTCTPAGD
jgi:hypothetical protein